DFDSGIKLSNRPSNLPDINYFKYYKEITINHLKVSEELNNFPLLLSIYDIDLHTYVQADGDDIAFSNDTDWLDHEIERFQRDFNGTHARLEAWIRIPLLSSTVDTKIYMYYGNSTMDSRQAPSGVWNSDYKAVWHLNTTLLDSTSNNNDGTNFEADDSTGYIGNGRDYDGVDDYSNMSSGSSIDNLFNGGASISTWIYPESWGQNDYGRVLAKSSVSAGTDGWVMCVDGEASPAADHHLLFFRGFDGNRGLWYTPEDSISLSQWNHVYVTYNDNSDSNVPSIYINGILQSLTPEPSPSGSMVDDSSQSLYIGNYAGGDRTFDGVIDEVRLTKGIKSSGWIQTEYNNQDDPSSFYTIGGSLEIDLIPPNITIHTPSDNDIFGMAPPAFNVEVNDNIDIDTKWYRLTNGTITTVNTTFSVNGSISQSRWNEIGNGTVMIQFFANDSWGNVGFSEITVRKDIISPTVNVNTPDNLNLFGNTPPTFNVEIQDVNSVDSMWYTLNDGLNELFTVNGTLSQTLWDECGNGSVSIKFYANDTLGNVGSSEVIVRKDIYNPIISIYAPELFDLCGDIAPNYTVSITDPNGVALMWYTLNDGVKTFFTGNGTISQTLWDECEDGGLSVKFHANDTLGNVGFSEVVVQKGVIPQTSFPWWIIIAIAAPLGLALVIVGLKKSKKKEIQVVIIDKELDKLKEKRKSLDTEAKNALKAYNYVKAAEIYEECAQI
ncbi:MAG: LamG-like jellyroll fold domain-containing protein, partial [Candidatus Hodarchaeales archaeon]